MKHRPVKEMLSDPKLHADPIAHYAVMSSGVSDHDQTTILEDLINHALDVEKKKHEDRIKELGETQLTLYNFIKSKHLTSEWDEWFKEYNDHIKAQ